MHVETSIQNNREVFLLGTYFDDRDSKYNTDMVRAHTAILSINLLGTYFDDRVSKYNTDMVRAHTAILLIKPPLFIYVFTCRNF